MKVPLSWLREFVEVAAEPPRLAEDLTLVGLAVDAIERHGDDAVLDIDVTTNRVDCMNVYGVAREVAVIYGLALRPLDASLRESGVPAAQALAVEVEASDLCPRFCARVMDVRLGPSPAWLRDRLEMVGVRPINNVVDLTNYVMMEMGHPSHAFDLARIPEARLRVRWALAGEELRTLDGLERALHPGIGVVAGEQRALALAGIMGGADSEVTDDTRTVALEAAYWDPLSIRRAAKSLGMHTEASHRFERGADPEGPPVATARLAHLLAKIGGGSTHPGLIDVHPAPRPRRTALLRPERARALLGAPVPDVDMERTLRGLGFGVERRAEGLAVSVPTWRGDVSREADLVEEVGRHYGLNRIASTVPAARAAEGLRPTQARERQVRDVLSGFGLSEVISYAFVSAAKQGAGATPAVRLANPLSEEQAVLRTFLVMPGLLGVLAANGRHGRWDMRLFEMGRVFLPEGDEVREERRLGLLISGARTTEHWSLGQEPADYFGVAGILQGLAARLGKGALTMEAGSTPSYLHPGQSARVRHGGAVVGWVGTLHPDVLRSWEARGPVVAAEMALDSLLAPPAPVRVQALPRFPGVSRDLAVVYDARLPATALVELARRAGGRLLRTVEVTDRYQGPPVPEGKVSLKLSLRFLDPERTLTGEEVQAAVVRVAEELAQAGALIRGE